MLKSSLCNQIDAYIYIYIYIYILASGTKIITGGPDESNKANKSADKRNKDVMFSNFSPLLTA